MRTIVTLVLVMVVGGYGVAWGQSQMEIEETTEMEEATNQFLGLEWGAGIGVMGSFGGETAVEKVSIIDTGSSKIVHIEEEGDLRPQMFLEMHVFLDKQAREWRRYQRWKVKDRMEQVRNAATPGTRTMPEPPLMGIGPFIALQSGEDDAIDALAFGAMWGFRRDPQKPASLNLGIGLSFDPSVQVLGKGMKEGSPLPNGETAVRLKKEGQFGWAFMASFTF